MPSLGPRVRLACDQANEVVLGISSRSRMTLNFYQSSLRSPIQGMFPSYTRAKAYWTPMGSRGKHAFVDCVETVLLTPSGEQ